MFVGATVGEAIAGMAMGEPTGDAVAGSLGMSSPPDISDPNTMLGIAMMADGGRGADSPVGEILRQKGVRIVINADDHAPPHAHVLGGGDETRTGQNGRPLRGDPELTRQQKSVIDDNRNVIRDAIRAYMRWFREDQS